MVTAKIIADIRENWQNDKLYNSKVINWDYINDFMYAVFCTIPIDKIPNGNSEDEIVDRIDNSSDFAEIGCLSGRYNPKDTEEIKESFLADLKSLGFKYRMVEENYKTGEKETKIAFFAFFGFYDIKFHILREIDGEWYHKNGWWSLPFDVDSMRYELMKKHSHLFMYLAIWRED